MERLRWLTMAWHSWEKEGVRALREGCSKVKRRTAWACVTRTLMAGIEKWCGRRGEEERCVGGMELRRCR